MTSRMAAKSKKSKLGNCVKCLTPTPAVTVQEVAFGHGKYRLPLCDRDADQMLDRFFEWARLGTIVDERDEAAIKPVANPDGPRRRGSGRVLRRGGPQLDLPAIVTMVPEDEPEVTPRMVHPRHTSPLLKADRWSWAKHAEDRLDERRLIASRLGLDPITRDDVLLCAEHPTVTRPGDEEENEGCVVHVRGDVHVVVNPETYEIVTVVDRRITKDKELELESA